jgi:hypothetical protein
MYVPKIPLSKLTHLNLSLLAMMFVKNFFIKFVYLQPYFPVLFPIEIKETSVRFHVFVFLKEERWFALLQKKWK